jgi:general stress protein 26
MSSGDIKQSCLQVMEKANVVVVTSHDSDGSLFSRAMFNLRYAKQFPRLKRLFGRHQDDLLVYLTTNASSKKVAQLRHDPRIALHYCIPRTFKGVMLGGNAEVTQDDEIRRAIWQNGWERYYPAGATDPDHAVIVLRPARLRGWLSGQPFDIHQEQGQ